jgi:tRNA(Arg) A34 adenosine deaminase TadA
MIGIPIVLAGAAAAGYHSFAIKKKRKEETTHGYHHSVQITLPAWAKKELPILSKKSYQTDEEMMSVAIHLSSMNVKNETGGPFGTAIFERHEDGSAVLVSVGVNRVVPLSNSTLHGEVVAIQLAQAKLKSFTMQLEEQCVVCSSTEENTKKKMRQFELFTSCEPCAMCLGATLWSGVSRIVCAATKSDAEAIGFDEGPVFEESYEHLRKSGVAVKKMVLQADAAKVLQEYGKIGMIYN